MVEIRSNLMRGRERGQPFGVERNNYCVERGAPISSIYRGMGGEAPLEEEAALGAAP
jgi:hypothetical protein